MAINLISPSVTNTAVLIGDTGTAPGGGAFDTPPVMTTVNGVNISAALEVQSTVGGFVPPRMTTTQLNAIVTPVAGMQVYDTTANVMKLYTPAGWAAVPGIGVLASTTVALTAVQIIAMEAAPVVLLAAPGAGFMYLPYICMIEVSGGGTAFTGGGAVSIQYGNTAAGAGDLFYNVIPALTFTTPVANKYIVSEIGDVNGGVAAVSTTFNNVGIYISNATAPFAAGNGTASIYMSYVIVPVT